MLYHIKPKDFNPKVDVSGCFLEYDGKHLLLLRQDTKPQPNTWGMPAGGREGNEFIEETVIRELYEETGYKCTDLKPEFLRTVFVRYPEADFTYHVFRLQLSKFHNVVISPTEHKDFKWVTPAEALTMELMPDQAECTGLIYGI